MKSFIYVLLTAAAVLQSCNQPEKEKKEASKPAISELFKNYYEEQLQLNPMQATFAGDNRYNDQLPNNISQTYLEDTKNFYTKYKDQLAQYDKSNLSEEEQLSYDILEWEIDMNLEALQFPTELTPVDQFSSMHLMIGQLAGGTSAQPFKTAEDYDNWLKRLDAFTVWTDTAIANMKKGMAQGYVLPKAMVAKTIPQLADLDHGPVEDHLFYSPVNLMPKEIVEKDRVRLRDAYKKEVKEKIIPAFEKLHTFMEEEYQPASRTSTGISAVPQGKELYNHLIKYYTTTDMTADQVFELGQQEVARISKEMEKVKQQVGFKGDLKAFFDFVRTNKKLMPFTQPEQVIEHFEEIHQTMKPHLQQLFDLTPKTPFEVRRTEAFREASASAEYNPGSLDGTRPGVFYVPVPDAKTYNIFSDQDLFLHEAIPGHHYQISLQQENKDLPDFRRTLWYSAYGEGWALYSESLGKELGLYDDPYQYFGMLSAEMHRAIRLVVDAGMHAKGWTREQAIQYSLDHEAEPESSVIAEIERYMAIPGQALSYKIGQLKILELRQKAKEALGDQFDIKEFHNKILESGCLPLELLENKINQWIEAERVAG